MRHPPRPMAATVVSLRQQAERWAVRHVNALLLAIGLVVYVAYVVLVLTAP